MNCQINISPIMGQPKSCPQEATWTFHTLYFSLMMCDEHARIHLGRGSRLRHIGHDIVFRGCSQSKGIIKMDKPKRVKITFNKESSIKRTGTHEDGQPMYEVNSVHFDFTGMDSTYLIEENDGNRQVGGWPIEELEFLSENFDLDGVTLQ